jgi:hypothetical protein
MRALRWAPLLFIDASLDKCSVGRSCHSIVCLSFVFCKFHSFRFVCSDDNKPFSGTPLFTSPQQQHARNFMLIFPLQFSVLAFRFEFWNLEVLEICRFYYLATYVLFFLFLVLIKLFFFCSFVLDYFTKNFSSLVIPQPLNYVIY